MTDPLASWWVHPVVIERYIGSGAYGDTFAAAETVLGFVHDASKLVTGTDGQQVVASAQIGLPKGTDYVPLKSRTTLPAQFGGRITTVVEVSVGDGGGQPTPDHVEIAVI